MQDLFQCENDENHNIPEKASDPDHDYIPDIQADIPAGTSQNRLDLAYFIAEVDRYQISDRAAAALSTALLRDLGLVTDGTAVNTGYKSGAIAETERNLGKPLQWLICLKHCNELPLRHVFDDLDGGMGTSGPNSFKGELGQAVAGDVYKEEVAKFDKIGSSLDEMPNDIFEKLSRDQKLLYRYAKAVIFGTVPDNLKDQKPGPLCHARWLTLALRILILYTRTANPSEALKKVVKFIVQVYMVMWFKISKQDAFTMGAKHLFEMMLLIKTQTQDV